MIQDLQSLMFSAVLAYSPCGFCSPQGEINNVEAKKAKFC